MIRRDDTGIGCAAVKIQEAANGGKEYRGIDTQHGEVNKDSAN